MIYISNKCNVTLVTNILVQEVSDMSRSSSGRIVIEIEPETKQLLHALLALKGLTLKGWFLERVDEYLDEAKPIWNPDLGRVNE